MPGNAEHTHHIRIRSTQLEMAPAPGADDYDGKLKAAQVQLEQLQQQREELERKKLELEELHERKHRFLHQQAELTEKLTSAITLIDRELFEMKQETEDLEQCRVCFAGHLDKLQKISPEAWSREQLAPNLDRAAISVDLASDEYDQAAAHFEGMRSGAIFGHGKRSRARAGASTGGDFVGQVRSGLAFNLPVVVLGAIALIIWVLK
jgi:DNA repair exonuclease SbcCD ATPase subunit